MIRNAEPQLDVIMYHYVRDLPRTQFPRIKGMLTEDFRRQTEQLSQHYEMATLESALEFLAGRYQPRRRLCLLTFDDGLKDHCTNVLSILAERKIQGLFFLVTGCIEDGCVLAVHKNHFLMAALEFEEYRSAFLQRLAELSPETDTTVDEAQARLVYRWDSLEVAVFKYILNFRVDDCLRQRILDELFAEHLGDQGEFARQLYVSWEEARGLQTSGMIVGGHSHRHLPLAKLAEHEQHDELAVCAGLLRSRLNEQALWPFSYPFGKPDDSFTSATAQAVCDLGFSCAFSTEVGVNPVGQDMGRLRRIDPKDIMA